MAIRRKRETPRERERERAAERRGEAGPGLLAGEWRAAERVERRGEAGEWTVESVGETETERAAE
jgi:hypothetical protein